MRASLQKKWIAPIVRSADIESVAKKQLTQDDEQRGRRIATARIRRGLTQEQLAKLLGMTDVTIWRWEKGESVPRPKRIDQLADILEVTKQWLSYGVGDGPAPIDPVLVDFISTLENKPERHFAQPWMLDFLAALDFRTHGKRPTPEIYRRLLRDLLDVEDDPVS